MRFLRLGALPLLPEPAKHVLRKGRDFAMRRGAIQRDWLTPDLRLKLESIRAVRTSQPAKPVARHGQIRQWSLVHAPYWQFAKGIRERNLALAGLEWRQPYWSHRMIEFAFATPEYLRHRPDMNRWLHRQAMMGRLPECVRQRQDKAEFSSTFKAYWPALRKEIERVAPLRTHWVLGEDLQARLDLAFTPQSSEWDEGPPWMLFGLDACLPSTSR